MSSKNRKLYQKLKDGQEQELAEQKTRLAKKQRINKE
jgi:hypothetical protein